MPRFVKRVSAFLAIGALSCAASAAVTINVDFNTTDGTAGTYSGTAAAPDTGTNWNGLAVGAKAGGPLITSVTSGPLLTSAGLTSPVTVSLGNFRAYDALPGDNRPAAVATALMTDFAYQQNLGPGGPDSTFSINNLNSAFTYDLYLYAQNGGYASTATMFTINSVSKVATDAGDIGSLIENTNYVVYRGLAPNASGIISGFFNDFQPADNAAFNGLQLVQIPEPAVASLLASAGLLTPRRRRS